MIEIAVAVGIVALMTGFLHSRLRRIREHKRLQQRLLSSPVAQTITLPPPTADVQRRYMSRSEERRVNALREERRRNDDLDTYEIGGIVMPLGVGNFSPAVETPAAQPFEGFDGGRSGGAGAGAGWEPTPSNDSSPAVDCGPSSSFDSGFGSCDASASGGDL